MSRDHGVAVARESLPPVDSAQERSPETPGGVSRRTGANPFDYQRRLDVLLSYFRDSGDSAWMPALRYFEPLADDRARLRLEVPFVSSDGIFRNAAAPDGVLVETPDDRESGLGDVSFRFDYLMLEGDARDRGSVATREASGLDREPALELGIELWAPTESDDRIGADQWVLGPEIAVGLFVEDGWILAPRYQHVFDISRGGSREEIHEGRAEVQLVKHLEGDRPQWLEIVPAWILDYEDHDYAALTLHAAFGAVVTDIRDDDVDVALYVKPGLGVGGDRPYDWMIEVGVRILGF